MQLRKQFRRFLKHRYLKFVVLFLAASAGLLAAFGIFSYLQNSDQNFSRGVLAINTDRAVYAPGEAVLLQMASLDSKGNTMCDSNLEIEVQEPGWWKKSVIRGAQGQIQKLPTCSPDNNVTNEPDYLARYTADKPGKYQLTLRNVDTEKKVKTSFSVSKQTPSVMISRSSPTRINPSKSDRYPMVITMTAKEDFKGQLVEKIPLDFKIAWQGEARISQDKNRQILTWEVELKAGETKSFAYEYIAPSTFPKWYKLGAIEVMRSKSQPIVESIAYWQVIVSHDN